MRSLLTPRAFALSIELSIALSIALSIGGCSPIYYPNAAYTTLPVESGEIIAIARGSTSGVEVQAAATPVKSLVVAGSASYLHVPGELSYTTHRYGELALGWSDTSGRAFYAALVGAGLGATATPPGSRYPWDDQTFDSARYTRVFAQATLGSLELERSILPGERANSGFALGLRLAWVRATSLWIDDQQQAAVDDFFIEPHVSWQSRGESLGVEVDLGVSMSPRGGMRFHTSPLRLGVGIVYAASGLF